MHSGWRRWLSRRRSSGLFRGLPTQKGFDLVAQIAEKLSERDVAVVALGTGEPVYEKFFREWAFWHPGKVAVQIRYDDALAHKIEAGSDMFLMPSRYEPSGLNQIYSLKYGTVPVVRATGGLDDTIEEVEPGRGTGNGFKFEGLEAVGLLEAIDRALAAFKDKVGWKKLMLNGMAQDFGWAGPQNGMQRCMWKRFGGGRRRLTPAGRGSVR